VRSTTSDELKKRDQKLKDKLDSIDNLLVKTDEETSIINDTSKKVKLRGRGKKTLEKEKELKEEMEKIDLR